jgi:hypothetical protein
MIPGGSENEVWNKFSLAAGRHALATNEGVFVWADSQNTAFTSITNNEFCARASGGVRFTTGGSAGVHTVSWTPGGAAWSFTSDRTAKENLREANPAAVLERVAGLPLHEWNYVGY